MKLLKEITLLTEAAGGVVAIPTTKKIEGESIWGMDGFTPSAKPIEDQVKLYINKMVGGDEEERQHFYDEVERVIFVPKQTYNQVLKAYKKLDIHGDSENDVANAFAQHLLVDAATKKVAVNLKKKKK